MAAKPKKKAKRIPAGRAPGRGGATGVSGQPRFIPTDAQRHAVCALVSIGTEHLVIAKSLQIPERTLSRHFKRELAEGRSIIHARVGGGIVAQALAGDKTMQIFYAKAQMGWRDRYSVGFDDEKGNAVNPNNLFTVNITG